VRPILERRAFISQTSCGICGKEMIGDLSQALHPLPPGEKIDAEEALARLEGMIAHQPLRRETGASHASVIYGDGALPISTAEDVGRHNALDKAIGKIFLAEKLREARYVVLSSRISYEMVQKGARAKIPILIALSRPTALAVELARTLNLTLATLAKEGGLYIYCGAERLRR
jgi:FdhD protein